MDRSGFRGILRDIPALIFFFGILSFLLALSCNGPSKNHYGKSVVFDKIENQINHINDTAPNYAIKYLDSCFRSVSNPGISDLCNKYFFKYHYFFRIKKDFKSAFLCMDSVTNIIENNHQVSENRTHFSRAFFYKGDIYRQQHQYRDAFKCYFQAKKIIETTSDSCMKYEYSNRLFEVSYYQGKYLNAIPYIKDNIREYGICNLGNNIWKYKKTQNDLDNIGLCYDHANQPDSAILYYQKALDYIDKNAPNYPKDLLFSKMARAIVIGNMGSALLKKGKTEEAEIDFKNSIKINLDKLYNIEDAQLTMVKLADLYLQIGNTDSCAQTVRDIQKTLAQFPNVQPELRLEKLLHVYFSKINEPAKAYQHLNTYMKLRDSLDEPTKNLASADVYNEIENLEKSEIISSLEKKDQMQSSYLWVLIMISVLTILIIFLLWNIWSKSKKHYLELEKIHTATQSQNDELQKALEALQGSQAENTRILKIVAHDLRNPVAAINGLNTIMLMDKDITEDQRRVLELIKISGSNLLEMISDLIYYNVSEEKIKMEQVEIHNILRQCVDLYKAKALEKKQTLSISAWPLTIMANQEKIWRVFSNLIINAIKFSPNGGLIELKMTNGEGSVIISVKDHGIGIPDQLKSNIFEMFSGAGRRGTSGESTFGLGLNICKQIVEKHHGRIWFQSEVNMGTTFFVELPLTQPSDQISTDNTSNSIA